MSNVEQYSEEIEDLIESVQAMGDSFRRLSGHDARYKVTQVLESFRSLFDRFAPFKIGDRVQLVRDINPKEDSGWYSFRHLLVEGHTGTVTGRGYRDGKFTFEVILDNQTFFGYQGDEIPIDRPYTFTFAEETLVPAVWPVVRYYVDNVREYTR